MHEIQWDSQLYNDQHRFVSNYGADVLQWLAPQAGENILDVGCGTGFIINLSKDLFDELHGVDATQAMLDKVDLSSGNIILHNKLANYIELYSKN